MTALGMVFPRSYPAALVTDVARRLEEGGADEMWVYEDCFYTAGPSLAAAALSVTERLTVGIGILPAVARTAAVTAMEIATLAAFGPGRLLPGIGHGVQPWMAQMGVKQKSPLTALEEVTSTVTRLLAGETVSFQGQTVFLDNVKLETPPVTPPPILLGVQGPKSMALAGRVAGGLILAEPATAPYVRQSLEQAGSPDGFVMGVFAAMCVREDRKAAYEWSAPWLEWHLGSKPPQLTALPFFDDLQKLYDESGKDGLVGMPSDWWTQIGAIGTLDDAAAHVETLEAAGVDHVGFFPDPEVEHGLPQLDYLLQLANR
ncbi:LLM class flavin-dependent oxidoreductase [Kribbella sp. NPDC026611]|uniref:LLM class flavin-dependent oxidoreductase n=1 Tax=Kribbella sp. NPDC026611 TaxID=3154911 RepID=UPI0033C5481F